MGVENGTYRLGELIEPKTFHKLEIDENGSVSSQEYTVCGRKIRLREIREAVLKKHIERGIVRAIDTDTSTLNRDETLQLIDKLDIPRPQVSY